MNKIALHSVASPNYMLMFHPPTGDLKPEHEKTANRSTMSPTTDKAILTCQ